MAAIIIATIAGRRGDCRGFNGDLSREGCRQGSGGSLRRRGRRTILPGAAPGGTDHCDGGVQVANPAGGRRFRFRRRLGFGFVRRSGSGHGGLYGGWSAGGSRLAGRAVGGFHLGDGRAHGNGSSLLGQNLDQRPVHGRGNFHGYLVGYNLHQRFVPFNPVARLLQPLADGSFNHRLANVGKFYGLGQGITTPG